MCIERLASVRRVLCVSGTYIYRGGVSESDDAAVIHQAMQLPHAGNLLCRTEWRQAQSIASASICTARLNFNGLTVRISHCWHCFFFFWGGGDPQYLVLEYQHQGHDLQRFHPTKNKMRSWLFWVETTNRQRIYRRIVKTWFSIGRTRAYRLCSLSHKQVDGPCNCIYIVYEFVYWMLDNSFKHLYIQF